MKNEALIANLKSIGLSDKAASIYAAVLEAGIAYPSSISQTTKLNRSTVYAVLNDLRAKGLVTQIERGKKISYQIEDPVHVQSLIKKQIELAETRYERAKKLLPELQGLFSVLPNKPRVRFFEGIEEVLSVFEEHVNVTEPYEMLSYSNVEKLVTLMPKSFIANYIKKKEKIGITTRAIFPKSLFSERYNKEIYPSSPKNILVRSRMIPAGAFPFTADITMFAKNKVSIINFHENVLIGVIIEDETIAGMMRMIFELAWKGVER